MYSSTVRVLDAPGSQEAHITSGDTVRTLAKAPQAAIPSTVNTAIVHDWLPVYAGAERVLEQFIHALPSSDLFSLVDFLREDQRGFLQEKEVQTSFIQRLPLARKFYRYYLPFVPFATEQFDLTPYDVIISSSYVAAKGVLTTADQLHISYIHSPIRYAWDLHFQYVREGKLKRGLKGLIARIILHYMRLYDVSTANRVDYYLANSRNVARRIWKTYRRKAEVVYPPVDTDAFSFCADKEDYYLTVARLVPYKKIDLLLTAFRSMPNKKLIVIGEGPEYHRLAAMASENVEILGYVPFEDLKQYMQHAKALLFAAEEDFGIVPVEAQACGTPVIAYGKGGARESVIPGETGLFFDEQQPKDVIDAVHAFDSAYLLMSPERIRANALRFSVANFQASFQHIVRRLHQEFLSKECILGE